MTRRNQDNEDTRPLLQRGDIEEQSYTNPPIGEDDESNVNNNDSRSSSTRPNKKPSPLKRTGIALVHIAAGISASIIILLILLAVLSRFWRIDQLQHSLAHVPSVSLDTMEVVGYDDQSMALQVVGNVHMDYSKVRNKIPRSKLRIITSLARLIDVVYVDESTGYFKAMVEEEANTPQSENNNDVDDQLTSFFPLFSMTVPPLSINIQPGADTLLNFTCKISDFGDPPSLSKLISSLLSRQSVTFDGNSVLKIHRLGFGSEVPVHINRSLIFDAHRDLLDIDLEQLTLNQSQDGSNVVVDTQLSAWYSIPVSADIPPLAWDLQIRGCSSDAIDDENDVITVSQGYTPVLHFDPESHIYFSVQSNLSRNSFNGPITEPCRGRNRDENDTPLDLFISKYLAGLPNVVTISGANSTLDNNGTPQWMSNLIAGLKFPFDFPGKSDEEDIVKEVEFSDVRLRLPNKFPFLTPPGTGNSVNADDTSPMISTKVRVVVQIPSLFDISGDLPIDAHNVRGEVDLKSRGVLFAHISLRDWIGSRTSRERDDNTGAALYVIEFELDKVPLQVLDEAVFSRVVREVMFNGQSYIRVESLVDAQVSSPMGDLNLSKLPAAGDAVLRKG